MTEKDKVEATVKELDKCIFCGGGYTETTTQNNRGNIQPVPEMRGGSWDSKEDHRRTIFTLDSENTRTRLQEARDRLDPATAELYSLWGYTTPSAEGIRLAGILRLEELSKIDPTEVYYSLALYNALFNVALKAFDIGRIAGVKAERARKGKRIERHRD